MADAVVKVVQNRAVVTIGGGDLVALRAAQGALPYAERAEQALQEIEEIASGAPDAPSILNKANRDGSNLDEGHAEAFRGAIGIVADLFATLQGCARETYYSTMRPEYSVAQNNAALAVDLVAGAGKVIVLPPGKTSLTSRIILPANTSLRGAGRYATVLDFSQRTSTGLNLINSTGVVDSTSYTLGADAGRDTKVLAITGSVAGLSVDDWVLVSSDEKDYVADGGESQNYGEWAHIDAISGLNVTLKNALRLPYTTAQNARVRKILHNGAVEIGSLSIIGTGQTHTAGGTLSGDRGIEVLWSPWAWIHDVYVKNCNGVGIRHTNSRVFITEDFELEVQEAQAADEIQYGFGYFGVADMIIARRFVITRGRHGIVQTGSSGNGFTFDVFISDGVVRDTYSQAYSEHSGLLAASYTNCTARSCGGGFDLRGRQRTVTNPRVIDCYNAAVGGSAFIFRDNVGEVEIVGMDVDDVRYIATCTTSNFTDDQAPLAITFRGGRAKRFQNGIVLEHKGGQNPSTAGAGTYNTAVGGIINLIDVDLYASPSRAGSTSTLPFSVSGYWNEVNWRGGRVEYVGATSPTYPGFFRGVERLNIDGVTLVNTRGIFVGANNGADSVTDATGAPATRNPSYVTMQGVDAFGLQTDADLIVTVLTAATTKIVRGLGCSASNVRLPNEAQRLTGSKSFDWPSVASGASSTTTVTVTGAALGDQFESAWMNISLQGMSLSGYVSAADTVTVVMTNLTGGALNLGTGALNASIFKRV
ncbi:MAG: hypothetical protein ACRED4_08780 [Brevundimonas sp.]